MFATFLVVLLTVLVIALAAMLTARLSRHPDFCVMDASKFFRAADPKIMMVQLNPMFEEGLRMAMSRRAFLRQQRKNLHSVLEFLRCMAHSTLVAIELAHNELERELVRRPGMEESEQYVERARNLQETAAQFRIYCLLGILKVRLWIVFRTQWWLPFAPARIASLSDIRGLNFYAGYHAFIQAVSALGQLHGEEFKESFLHALIKTDPLDELLGR